MKKYFSYVPMPLCIIINAILGTAASGAVIIALVFIGGLFRSPTLQEQMIGIAILLGIAAVIVAANFVTYLICKKKRAGTSKNIDGKNAAVRFIIIAVIILLLGLSFFILPDLWIALNDWWF